MARDKRTPVGHPDPERALSESVDALVRELAAVMRDGAYRLEARALELGLPVPPEVELYREAARRARLKARRGRGRTLRVKTRRPDLRLVSS